MYEAEELFKDEQIQVIQPDINNSETAIVARLPLSEIEACYNLLLAVPLWLHVKVRTTSDFRQYHGNARRTEMAAGMNFAIGRMLNDYEKIFK